MKDVLKKSDKIFCRYLNGVCTPFQKHLIDAMLTANATQLYKLSKAYIGLAASIYMYRFHPEEYAIVIEAWNSAHPNKQIKL